MSEGTFADVAAQSIPSGKLHAFDKKARIVK